MGAFRLKGRFWSDLGRFWVTLGRAFGGQGGDQEFPKWATGLTPKASGVISGSQNRCREWGDALKKKCADLGRPLQRQNVAKT